MKSGISNEEICEYVEDSLGLARGMIASGSRQREATEARRLALYFMRHLNNASWDEMTNYVGGDCVRAIYDLYKIESELKNGARSVFHDVQCMTLNIMNEPSGFRRHIMTSEITTTEMDNESALKSFVLDIECLNALDKWTDRFNVFDVLKVTRTEIRHSNMLAWLLDPNENHGLGDSVLRGFVQYAASFSADDAFEDLLMELGSFDVKREWANIDVLIASEVNEYALIIENKIDSAEHSDQLNRYRSIAEETFPNWRRRYILLSPEGVEASDPAHWLSMGYKDVLRIVESAQKGKKLFEGANILIENYLEVIRRDIVNDDELNRVCSEIYTKHKRALDLIYENRTNISSEFASIVFEWAHEKEELGLLVLSRDKCTKKYTRFKTPFMTSFLPDDETHQGMWGSPDQYFYEVVFDGKYRLEMCASIINASEKYEEKYDLMDKEFPDRARRGNYKSNCYFITKKYDVVEPLDPNKIRANLDSMLDDAMVFEGVLRDAIQALRV